MASRVRSYLARNPSWQKMGMNELVDLMTKRTGLDKREVRRALQELENTSVYVKSRKSSGGGRSGNRRARRKPR